MDPNESTPHHFLACHLKVIPSQLFPTISHTQLFTMSHFNDLSRYTYTVSTNTVVDETAAAEKSLDHEKKLKRLASNRESVRRSRMRKKMQVQELQHEVEQLYVANYQLSEKLIRLLDYNKQIIQENEDSVSSLQNKVADLIDGTF